MSRDKYTHLRQEELTRARGDGLKVYNSEVPCKKHGEGVERYTSNGVCVRCSREHGVSLRRERVTVKGDPKPRQRLTWNPGLLAWKGKKLDD